MILYHFTAERFLPSIRREGLTKGRMVKTMDPPSFISNVQWITKNHEFDQSWSHGTGRLAYKRNEVRLSIHVAEGDTALKPWLKSAELLTPEVAADLSAFGDPQNWYCYFGQLAPSRIVMVEFNPAYSKGTA